MREFLYGAFSRAGVAAALAVAGLGLACGSAQAVSVSFSSAEFSGTDPLGHNWDYKLVVTTGSNWYLPNRDSHITKFNLTSMISNGNGNWATGFSIKFDPPPGFEFVIDTTPGTTGPYIEATQFVNYSKNELWNITFIGTYEVLFTAPAGSRIDVGDVFLVQVFADLFDDQLRSPPVPFTARWLDGSEGITIPAPAGLPVLAAGMALLGWMRRRNAA